MRRFRLAVILTGAVFLGLAVPVFAQSCSLCYTQAASATARFIQGLREGIFVLIIPPMFLSVGITYLAYSKRNKFRQSDDGGSGKGW